MAKSPLIGKMNNRVVSAENIIELPPMVMELTGASYLGTRTFDFEKLMYRNCDITQRKPTINRDRDIIKIATHYHQNKMKITGLVELYYTLSYFIMINDKDDISPFSKNGLINLSRHLWFKVQSYDPLKKLWNYDHGEDLGLRESTGYQKLGTIQNVLKNILDYEDSYLWLENERPFNKKGGVEPYQSYDSNELKLSTRRLTLYFTQLATKLVEYKKYGDADDLIKVSIDNSDWLVPATLKGRKLLIDKGIKSGLAGKYCTNTTVLKGLAFNQAMVAAYYLLSYFTAFNTSPLLEIRKPLTITESKAEEWYQLDAYKGRSSSNVEALLGGKTHKKSLEFIKLLVSLSDAYNEDSHGLLLYMLANDNTSKPMDNSHLKDSRIIDILDLNSSNKGQCVKHLCDMNKKLINRFQALEYICPIYTVVNNQLKIKERPTTRGAMATRISTISFAILDAIKLEDNVQLKGIVLPIGIEDIGEFVNLSFRYISGELGNITIPSQFLNIVEKQLEFAIFMSRPTKPNGPSQGDLSDYTIMRKRRNYFPSPLAGYNPMYLIPFGANVNGFKQWEGLSPFLKVTFNEIGIRTDDYRISLNASRMRETNATIIRAKKGSTINDVVSILQNTLQTTLTHYGEDNKQQNSIIISQGVQVIQETFTDNKNNDMGISKDALERAKYIVKEKLDVEVLEYDQYLELGRQQNGIGMHCSSPYDPTKNRKITREANMSNLLNKGEVLACHEYIDCVVCIHSKLINDEAAIYRLFSFMSLLEEFRIFHLTEAHYKFNFGDAVSFLQELINAKIPKLTINKAKLQLETQGRHPAWDDVQLVEQFIL